MDSFYLDRSFYMFVCSNSSKTKNQLNLPTCLCDPFSPEQAEVPERPERHLALVAGVPQRQEDRGVRCGAVWNKCQRSMNSFIFAFPCLVSLDIRLVTLRYSLKIDQKWALEGLTINCRHSAIH